MYFQQEMTVQKKMKCIVIFHGKLEVSVEVEIGTVEL